MQNNSFENLKVVTNGNYKGLVFYKNKDRFMSYYRTKLTNDFAKNIIHSDLAYRQSTLKDLLLYENEDGWLYQLNDFDEKHKIIYLPIVSFKKGFHGFCVCIKGEFENDTLHFSYSESKYYDTAFLKPYSTFIITHYCLLIKKYFSQFSMSYYSYYHL